MKGARVWFALVAVVIVLVAAWGARRYGPSLEAALLGYDVIGVDVSNHQGPVDWPTLKADGVAFAYIKASEGATFVDARFAANWAAARDAGIPRGAYHFFTLCQPGQTQARHFLRTIQEVGDLAPAVDAEHMGPCRKGPTTDDPAREVAAFIDEVERIAGVRPIVYTTRQFHDAHLLGRLEGERFWLRSLGVPPGYRRDEWVLWQFDNAGRRRGVSGPVDLNAFRGDRAAFKRFAGAEPPRARRPAD